MSEGWTLIHPGPVAAEGIAAVPCIAVHQRVTLKAGLTLLQAMVDAVGEVGAWFDLDNVSVEKLTFVRPAPAPDDRHVAWYSAQTVLTSATIKRAGSHLGRRDGAAFAHVHGLWADSNGSLHAGHLLAETTVLSTDHTVDVWVLEGALFDMKADAETGFTLFHPVSMGAVEHPNATLATIRPNELLEEGLAKCSDATGLRFRTIKGLGSLVRTKLEGQPILEDDAAEILLTGDAGRGGISVGFEGPPIIGDLALGANRVCVTFEVLLLS